MRIARAGLVRARCAAWALPLAAASSACHGASSSDPPDQPASPQAKAEPAPIVSAPTPAPSSIAAGASASAGAPFTPPPQPLRPDEPAPPDVAPKESARDGARDLTPREGFGREQAKDVAPVVAVSFALRSSDVALPPKGVELSNQGVEVARRKSEPTLTADLTPGHARVVLEGGFVLPDASELRVRSDRYGYVVVSPDGESYRVGATGSLRAVLGEGLFDVAPSSLAEVVGRGAGALRLGHETRRVEVTTRAARGSFELARFPEAGDGGVLLCRMLLDLMSTAPSTPVCADGDVPLHVELKWSAQPARPSSGRGRISGVSVFEAVAVARRSDVPPSSFLAPPPGAKFVFPGDAVHGARMFLSRADLVGLRSGVEAAGARAVEGPSAVLSLHNSSDELRYVWLDGVPLAWLAPGGRSDIAGVPNARATLQWRTFFGDTIDPALTVTPPAMVDADPVLGSSVTSADNLPP